MKGLRRTSRPGGRVRTVLRLRSPAGMRPSERLTVSLIVLVAILVAGTTGYMLLGLSVLDATYQTVITISTVGFGDHENPSARYHLFTIGLILLGTGTTLYTIGVVIEMLFEGWLDDQFRRRRMQRSINRFSGHVLVCGYGQVGRAITADIRTQGTDVVVIDRDRSMAAELEEDGLALLLGDATDDQVLRDAGIERARALVLALDSDVDNLYVALSARALRAKMLIVARANDESAVPKLLQAGANQVVNPHKIGGARMAALALAGAEAASEG